MNEPKYQTLFDELKTDIISGRYGHGEKMPSEAALVHKTGLSRITVARAFRELQAAGLVERVAGSGSYAKGAGILTDKAYLFGLLIPELGETEIFSHICRAIASAPQARSHALLWGNPGAGTTSKQAMNLADQFIQRGVDGVFFAPLEYGNDAETINRRILHKLRKKNIAVVLLDRRIGGLSSRDRADIVGLNHRHAAYLATERLISSGCRKLCLVSFGGNSSSVVDRRAGFAQALVDYKRDAAPEFDIKSSPQELRSWLRNRHPVGAFCINDRIAGQVLHFASAWKRTVPQDLRVVGIDDLGYATMMPIPLTTIRQPTEQIGESALQLILERIRFPHRPARELLLDGALVERETSGPRTSHNGAADTSAHTEGHS